jgi:hypothetical protein
VGGGGRHKGRPPIEHKATPHTHPNRRHSQLISYCPQPVLYGRATRHAQQTAQQRTRNRARAITTQSNPVSTITPRHYANSMGGGDGAGGAAQCTHHPQSTAQHNTWSPMSRTITSQATAPTLRSTRVSKLMPRIPPSKGRTTEHQSKHHEAPRSAQSHHGVLLTQWVGGWGGAGGTRCRPPTEHKTTQHTDPL